MAVNLVGSTAHWTAAVRAKESERPDRLFDDPWAAALAGEAGMAWLEPRTPDSLAPIVLRTRYFDDFLQRITRQSGIRQVVLLAAGLDTRAFRLSWRCCSIKSRFSRPPGRSRPAGGKRWQWT